MKKTLNSNNEQPVEPPPDDQALREREIALRQRIETQAYHLWLTSGGSHGEHLRHWLQAESEILKAERRDQAERNSSVTPVKPRSSPATNEANPKK